MRYGTNHQTPILRRGCDEIRQNRFAMCFNELRGMKSPLLVSLLLPLLLHAGDPPVAQKFLTLFDDLRAADAQRRHVAFALSDREITDYMRYSLHATPRPGLDSVTVKIFPQNYVSTFTVVDFDAIERWKPGTIPVVLRPVLHGKQSIRV